MQSDNNNKNSELDLLNIPNNISINDGKLKDKNKNKKNEVSIATLKTLMKIKIILI